MGLVAVGAPTMKLPSPLTNAAAILLVTAAVIVAAGTFVMVARLVWMAVRWTAAAVFGGAP